LAPSCTPRPGCRFFADGLSLPYLVTVVGPFMILPNVGLNEWGHTFWFMEELFVAPLHYGFVFFGWLALAIAGVLLQSFRQLRQPDRQHCL
jgi:methane/ammonia monooxygenase subunit C